MYAAIIAGWKMMLREAYCRCCAIESATNLRAAILSSSAFKVVVMRGGIPSRGFGGGRLSSSAFEVIVASEDVLSGRRVCDEEGCRRGVEVFELTMTRFARRKEKKAFGRAQGLARLLCLLQNCSSSRGVHCSEVQEVGAVGAVS